MLAITESYKVCETRKEMKKILISAIALLCFSALVYAVPNYNNGNGTIMFESEYNGVKTVIRKCELEVTIGDLLRKENRFVYDKYVNGTIIGKLKDNDNIEVLEVCTIAYLNKPKNKWGNPSGEVWYKIKLNKMTGWICLSSTTIETYTDPYYNNRYEIIEKIESTGKIWTIRALEQDIAVWEKLNVRDKPGLDGKKIFLLHDFEEGTRSPQENHTTAAITEETETIDGLTDHWLKIEYAPKAYGWIFGGYVSVARGGPKYYTPEDIVRFYLGRY